MGRRPLSRSEWWYGSSRKVPALAMSSWGEKVAGRDHADSGEAWECDFIVTQVRWQTRYYVGCFDPETVRIGRREECAGGVASPAYAEEENCLQPSFLQRACMVCSTATGFRPLNKTGRAHLKGCDVVREEDARDFAYAGDGSGVRQWFARRARSARLGELYG